MVNLGQAHVACWVLLAASAAAQTAKPDVEAAAAMERAKRLAAGPMRIILEASKARRKTGEADSPVVAEPVAKSTPARTTAASLAPPAAADARLLVATTSTGDAVRTAAPAAPAPESAPLQQPAAQPRLPSAAPPSTPTLISGFLQSKAAGAAVPALEATATPALSSAPLAQPVALPFAAVPLPAAAPAVTDRPRLLTMIEPDIPQRVLDQMGRNATVMIDLTLRADGSVAKVALLSPAPRQLERALAATLEQWKFEALPSERVHRVELVFNPER